jgi:hypothetical protein
MLSVGTTASAGLKDWVHSFYSNLNVLESGLANQNYDSLLSMPTRSHFTSHDIAEILR